jgi:predicted O-methyltransferase YrrM
MRSVRRRLRPLAVRLATRLAQRFGLDVVADPIYSPIPKVPPPDAEIWTRKLPMDGIHFDLDAQLGFLEGELRPYLAEFDRELVDKRDFDVWNGLYEAGDAQLLYALLRHLKPAQVLELGSGFSTLVSAAAAAANLADGTPTELTAVDPEPRTQLSGEIEGLARLELSGATRIPLERFEALGEGDVLFVDTSHAVKLGSEVNWLVLEVLPRLRPGVLVHFHDVFLPYEYPRYLLEIGAYFNEQYLLHAFLIGNDAWGVVLAAAALNRERRERMVELIPSLGQEWPGLPGFYKQPSAFWIRRRA